MGSLELLGARGVCDWRRLLGALKCIWTALERLKDRSSSMGCLGAVYFWGQYMYGVCVFV